MTIRPRSSRIAEAGILLCLLVVNAGCTDTPAHVATAPSPVHADTTGWPDRFGFGSPASESDVARWDIDVMADGTGLPPGEGRVERGRAIYAAECAACHGRNGEGGAEIGLVGRIAGDAFPFADSLNAPRRIGNYWPYAPTLFDYIRRSMPFDRPGSLTDGEVYDLTAFLLHLNEIIPEDAVLDAETLSEIKMPARDRFVPDDRLQYHVVH